MIHRLVDFALRQRLVIIGSGQDEARLRSLAGPTIHFLGWQPDEAIRDHFRRCRALIFPGEEDFGIVPVEANACGTPVIAFGRGGATETIVPLGGREAPSGVWFMEQGVECLIEAIEHFAKSEHAFPAAMLRRRALQFTSSRFERELFAYIDNIVCPQAAPLHLAA